MVRSSPSPTDIIRKHYQSNPEARKILLDHSRKVTKRALIIARRLIREGADIDLQFLAEAAMLHDIGMILTHTPSLSCFGSGPYLQHGIKGKQLLIKEGLPRHAEVCERHIGVGLSTQDIREQNLPLPEIDMAPQTLEQEIISYADLFYSKSTHNCSEGKSVDKVAHKLARFGPEKVDIFKKWVAQFEPELLASL